MVHVAIIEDNKTAARLLRAALEAEGLVVDGVFRSGEEALDLWSSAPCPPIVFMDLQLPGISGIETTKRLKAQFGSGVDVIVQTMFEDSDSIFDAIRAGISGYLLKASPPDELAAAVAEVLRGGSFLTGKVARRILDRGTDQQKSPPEDYRLTEREAQILRHLVDGLSYKEIAGALFLSVHTVNNHLRKVYEKMRVTSRHEATARARGEPS